MCVRVPGESEGELAGMTDSDGTIRGYSEFDFAVLLRLRNAAAELAADGEYLAAESLRGNLRRPGYVPIGNLFVAKTDGEIVGYVDVIVEMKLGRAIVAGYVEPGQRRRGLGGALYRQAEKRARQAGVRVVQVNVNEKDREVAAVLTKHGFAVVRRFVEMDMDISRFAEKGEASQYPMRRMRDGEAARLADIQNRSFDGSWGFSPNTAEEIAHSTSGPEARDGVRLAIDSDRVAGYCWMVRQRAGEDDEPRGRVTMIGVDPDYQGQGVGRDLLRDGLVHARDSGLKTVRLTVDDQNRTAHSLYLSMGFVEGEAGVWYEKPLG